MTVRGENQWPYTGTSTGRSRGELPAVYGEFLMAAVTVDIRRRALADRVLCWPRISLAV